MVRPWHGGLHAGWLLQQASDGNSWALQGTDVDDAEKTLTRPPSDDAPLSALAFKIMSDKFVGSLTFVRIYRCTAFHDWLMTASSALNRATQQHGMLLLPAVRASGKQHCVSCCYCNQIAGKGLHACI